MNVAQNETFLTICIDRLCVFARGIELDPWNFKQENIRFGSMGNFHLLDIISRQILTNACDSVNASGRFFSLSSNCNENKKPSKKTWWNFHHKLPVAYAKSINKREIWKLFRIGKDFDENSICLKKKKNYHRRTIL